MDFDTWWEQARHMMPSIVKIDAREAWIAATKIERKRCAELCDSLGGPIDPRDPDEVMLAANSLADAVRTGKQPNTN